MTRLVLGLVALVGCSSTNAPVSSNHVQAPRGARLAVYDEVAGVVRVVTVGSTTLAIDREIGVPGRVDRLLWRAHRRPGRPHSRSAAGTA